MPNEPRAAVVVCHPHPLQNGSMNAIVPSEVMRTFPGHEIAVLRFNFRGVGKSQGSFEDGRGERLDAISAINAMHEITEGLPLVLVGSSFGADTAMTIDDGRLDAWVLAAPGFRAEKVPNFASVGADARPKLILSPQRDEICSPEYVQPIIKDWNNTTFEIVPGATHYLVGRVPQTVERIREFVLRTRNANHNSTDNTYQTTTTKTKAADADGN